MQITPGAFAHFHIDDAFLVGEVVVYSCIYNLQGKAVLPAEEIDTCPSMKEVADLLPGDFLWRQTGDNVCCMSPIWSASSSKMPNEPLGLVRLLILSINAGRIDSSGRVI